MAEVKNMFSELKPQQEWKFDGFLVKPLNLYVCYEYSHSTNEEIKFYVKFLSQQYDEMLKKMNQLETQNSENRNQIKLLESKLELAEKNSRASTIEICNIPKVKQENKQALRVIVKSIGSVVSPQNCIQENELRDVFRLKSDAIVVNCTPITRKNLFFIKSNTTNPKENKKALKQIHCKLTCKVLRGKFTSQNTWLIKLSAYTIWPVNI